MANRRRHYKPANVFRTFIAACPIILIPAAALLFETWLNLGILTLDYESGALSKELDRAQVHIEELRARVAELERIDRIDSAAIELGLVKREHNQLVIVNDWSPEGVWDPAQGFDVANGRAAFIESLQTTGLQQPE
ncbi:MAG TPA: hypothetical protein PKY01_06980 [Candidatus Hydrogenedentes bacterium]|nr:hypothetical protein [Candidatus Hydrogenedentota bacterium]HQH52151.1 hypothetical protein [Candidatus Hydrogenedentota bacterium]HQM48299.1 hypothetical protein [Candidatus Hydrogenedentota bacterium]